MNNGKLVSYICPSRHGGGGIDFHATKLQWSRIISIALLHTDESINIVICITRQHHVPQNAPVCGTESEKCRQSWVMLTWKKPTLFFFAFKEVIEYWFLSCEKKSWILWPFKEHWVIGLYIFLHFPRWMYKAKKTDFLVSKINHWTNLCF